MRTSCCGGKIVPSVSFEATATGTSTLTATSPTSFAVHTTGSCTDPTFGAFTFVANETAVIDSGTLGVDAVGRLLDGTVTYTFASGSTLSRAYAGTLVEIVNTPVVDYDVDGPVTGGTGIFSKTSGQIRTVGTVNLGTSGFAGVYSGKIFLRKDAGRSSSCASCSSNCCG